MIVPAKKCYFNPCRFSRGVLKDGETFSFDNGMGGSWLLEFLGYTRHEQLVFRRNERPDWPAENFYFTDERDAARRLFILVPENRWLGEVS